MKNNKIVFTNGCFDILHRGHIELLNYAKSLGNKLILGLNSDSSVKRLKGENRPINNEVDRKLVLENLRMVDQVIVFEEDTPLNLIKKIKPDILVKGGDYSPEKVVGSTFVGTYGGQVICWNFIEGYSTTKVIKRFKEVSASQL